MARQLSVEERRQRLSKEKPKQLPAKRQLAFLMAQHEMFELIRMLKDSHPVLAKEMESVLFEMTKAIPTSDNSVKLMWLEYPGLSERRRQRYEERKAYLLNLREKRWAAQDDDTSIQYHLQEVERDYNSPLLTPQEPTKPREYEPSRDGLAALAMFSLMMAELKRAEEAGKLPQDESPYVDPDVWNLDDIDFDGK